MKIFLLVICVILYCGRSIDATPTEVVSHAIDACKEAKETIDKVKDIFLKANPAKIFAKFSKVLGVLGPAMMAVSAILSVVAMFLPKEDSKELKAINAGFEQVNRKLDVLTTDIRDLKNIIELTSAKSAYIKCLTAIDSNYAVLLDAQKDNNKASYDYFVKHYEMSYDLAASNLFDAMTGKLGPFGFNLVNLYKEHVKCNPVLLSKFCTMGMQILSKGLTIEGAYLGALNLTAKTVTKKEAWEGKLKVYGESCSAVIENCESNWKAMSAQHFRESYKRELSDNNDEFAKKVAKSLDEVAPQKSWLVVAYKDAGGFGEHGYSSYYEADQIWNENNHDVTIFSTTPEEPRTGESYEAFKRGIEEQKNKLSSGCNLNSWLPGKDENFGGSDLRSMNNVLRKGFGGGVVYSVRSDKNPGHAATGNTLYSTDLQWNCNSQRYRVIIFV